MESPAEGEDSASAATALSLSLAQVQVTVGSAGTDTSSEGPETPPIPIALRGGLTSEERRRIQFSEAVGDETRGGASDDGSTLGLAAARKVSGMARRKKSIRITLDDDRDSKSDPGSISTMLERKIRFEESSPTTPITPLGSVASNDTSIYDDKCAWNWRRNTNIDGVGSLVQSFFQFAREIGDGGLSYVSFELPTRKGHHKHTPRKKQHMHRSAASMGVLTCRDSCCVVALFFDDRQLKVSDPEVDRHLRAYMESVRERFTSIYAAKVESLRPTLKDVADGKNQDLQIPDIQKLFIDFENVALELRQKHVPECSVTPPLSS